ncbi:MAG: hypothetical protein H6611_10230 [Ignavibacteriales bacterium]|nr:hypothetical protein [Ignavibacteriales bacterium]
MGSMNGSGFYWGRDLGLRRCGATTVLWVAKKQNTTGLIRKYLPMKRDFSFDH